MYTLYTTVVASSSDAEIKVPNAGSLELQRSCLKPGFGQNTAVSKVLS